MIKEPLVLTQTSLAQVPHPSCLVPYERYSTVSWLFPSPLTAHVIGHPTVSDNEGGVASRGQTGIKVFSFHLALRPFPFSSFFLTSKQSERSYQYNKKSISSNQSHFQTYTMAPGCSCSCGDKCGCPAGQCTCK